MKLTCLLIALSLVIITGNGCSSKKIEHASGEVVHKEEAADTSELSLVHLYSLPAPLQIPSAIKSAIPTFYGDLLMNPSSGAIGSNFKKATTLGILGVDLGYASLYENNQIALNLLDAIARLASDLNISGGLTPDLVQKYKDNITNRDSLNYLILSSYNAIDQQLNSGHRSDEAIYILTGGFIEGLYLSTEIYQKKKEKLIRDLIGQQKLFLENVTALFPASGGEESQKLHSLLKELNTLYQAVQLTYDTTSTGPVKNITAVNITDDQVKAISQKIGSIRKMILS